MDNQENEIKPKESSVEITDDSKSQDDAKSQDDSKSQDDAKDSAETKDEGSVSSSSSSSLETKAKNESVVKEEQTSPPVQPQTPKSQDVFKKLVMTTFEPKEINGYINLNNKSAVEDLMQEIEYFILDLDGVCYIENEVSQ